MIFAQEQKRFIHRSVHLWEGFPKEDSVDEMVNIMWGQRFHDPEKFTFECLRSITPFHQSLFCLETFKNASISKMGYAKTFFCYNSYKELCFGKCERFLRISSYNCYKRQRQTILKEPRSVRPRLHKRHARATDYLELTSINR